MPSRELAERYPNLLAIGGHPSVHMPQHVVAAATRAAERAVYAPTRGLLPLREAIAERIGAELGRAIDPESEVLITLGGMQGLYLAAQAFGARASRPEAPTDGPTGRHSRRRLGRRRRSRSSIPR
jgi:aspartate/methionine/tyrosine aminotransferase